MVEPQEKTLEELHQPEAVLAEEDRILRVWTPVLLRSILIVSAIVLVIGLFAMAAQSPDAYISRFRRIQSGEVTQQYESFQVLVSRSLAGHPHSIVILGLLLLTLVPLARVAFCFFLFIRERDGIFVIFTAYVLAGLVAGVILGRIG